MTACRHTSIISGRLTWSLARECYREYACHVCRRCGAWLSLGEANDTKDAVVERRAAALADAMSRVNMVSALQGPEYVGWSKHQSNGVPELLGEWAGWLAREVWVNAYIDAYAEDGTPRRKHKETT